MNNSSLSRRQLLTYLGVGTAALGAGAATLWTGAGRTLAKDVSTTLPVGKPLPEFKGVTEWLNSAPLTTADLKGKVVLIHIWTFECINCQRTLPYVVGWHQKYASQGLQVVGIHTPEFPFERSIGNIKNALKERNITYPNAVDNQFAMWKAYDNQYWPHLFIADREGRLRYDHIGEGAYDTTEQVIRTLLG